MTTTQPARIFVGIKVTDEVAQELAELARPLEQQVVRLVPTIDIHLTLVPPWNEINIAAAAETLQAAISYFKPFVLTFVHLGYGPKLREPRLLWVECAASTELTDLRTMLLTAYGKCDSRPFLPHVSLARMLRNGRRIARRNPIDRTLLLTQLITSVELFRSSAHGQSGYRVLASLPLGCKPDAKTEKEPESGAGQNCSGIKWSERMPS